MRQTRLALILSLLLCAQQAFASKEGVLVWSSFSIHSVGIGNSGPVDISGTYAEAGLTKLVIKAFGKEYVLSAVQLQQVQGLYVNGMQLSYVNGYAEEGGRSIYLVLTGLTGGTRAAKRITLDDRGLSITSEIINKAAEQ